METGVIMKDRMHPLLDISVVYPHGRSLPLDLALKTVVGYLETKSDILVSHVEDGILWINAVAVTSPVHSIQISGGATVQSNCVLVTFLGKEATPEYRGEPWILELGDALFERLPSPSIQMAGYHGAVEDVTEFMAKALILGRREGAIWLNGMQADWLNLLSKDSTAKPIYLVRPLSNSGGIRLDWPRWWGQEQKSHQYEKQEFPWFENTFSHFAFQDILLESFTVVGFGEAAGSHEEDFGLLLEAISDLPMLHLNPNPFGRSPETLINGAFEFFLYHRDHPEYQRSPAHISAQGLMKIPFEKLKEGFNLARLSFDFIRTISCELNGERVDIHLQNMPNGYQRQLLMFPIDPSKYPEYEYDYVPPKWMKQVIEHFARHFGWKTAAGAQVGTCTLLSPDDMYLAPSAGIPLLVNVTGETLNFHCPKGWFER